MDAIEVVDLLLPEDIIVVAFDFSGYISCLLKIVLSWSSGLSEGEYVTLGYNEQDDLKCVVAHIRKFDFISEY